MAFVTTPLVSPAVVKVALPLRRGNDDFNDKISLYILTATQQIERHTGRLFTSQPMVETYDTADALTEGYDLYNSSNEWGVVFGARQQRFILKAYPVDMAQPFTVLYDPSRQFSSTLSAIPSRGYDVDTHIGILRTEIGTFRSMKGLQVSYTGGYGITHDTNLKVTYLTDIDPLLSMACAAQVQFLFSKLHPDNIAMDSDRSKGLVTRTAQVSKFLTAQGLTREAAEMVMFIKPIAMGRH